MRNEIQKWHSITLQAYNAIMFESLIHKHNITTESASAYQFEDDEGVELSFPLRGYFAMKEINGDKAKYFIEEKYVKDMPIRVNEAEEIFFKVSARSKSVVKLPVDITPFKIKPEACFDSHRQFVDNFAPFKHSEPDQWTLNKITAMMSYVGKTFCGICSHSEFGKSSIYLILDALTTQCPVFQPRSVPGVLAQINCEGNMVFDEVHDVPGEVKSCMENFSLQVAGNSPIYINGAMRSKNTKSRYDVSQQSITYLYNVYGNYSKPDKQFWNNIWSNTKAMESRFLCLKFDGKLLEEFDKKFDIVKVAEDNKMFYIKLAKHLLHLKSLKLTHKYTKRYNCQNTNVSDCSMNQKDSYSNNNELKLHGRHKILYEEIVWGIDLYCNDQAEFEKFVRILNKSITGYYEMISAPVPVAVTTALGSDTVHITEEEVVEQSPQQKIMEVLNKNKRTNLEELKAMVNVDNFDDVIEMMRKEGDIFFPSPSEVTKL